MKKEFNPILEENKPKVILYEMSTSPLRTITNCYKMIEEEIPVKDLKDIPLEIIEKQVANAKTTLLQMPLELVYFYMYIDNVPRVFTHKICEYKYGLSLKQQSMRFVSKVWNNFRYALPNSIKENSKSIQIVKDYMAFVKEKYELLFEIERKSKVEACTTNFFPNFEELKDLTKEQEILNKMMFNTPISDLEEKSTKYFIWILDNLLKDNKVSKERHYEIERRFIEVIKQSWTQIQDAREVLPRNILTGMNVGITFRTLLQIAREQGKQEYWKDFFEELKNQIKLKNPEFVDAVIRWIDEAISLAPEPKKTIVSNVQVKEAPIAKSPIIRLEDKEASEYSVKRIKKFAQSENISIMDFLRKEYKRDSNKIHGTWFDFEALDIQESISHQYIRHRIENNFVIPEISLYQKIDEPLKYYDFIERDTEDFRGWIITKKHKEIMKQIVAKAQDARIALVNLGIPVEDASHILPILVTNNFKFSTSLGTLMSIAAERISQQASWFWSPLMKQIKNSIQSLWQDGIEVASLLLPAGVLWGKNPFQATFDRKEKYKPEEIFNLWEAYSRKNYLLFKQQYGDVFFDELTREEAIELEELSDWSYRPVISKDPFYEKMIEEELNLTNMWFNSSQVKEKMLEKYTEEDLKNLEFYDQLKNTVSKVHW